MSKCRGCGAPDIDGEQFCVDCDEPFAVHELDEWTRCEMCAELANERAAERQAGREANR